MKYTLIMLMVGFVVLLLHAQLHAQDGAGRDKLEKLKEAWKRDTQENKNREPVKPGSVPGVSDPLELVEKCMKSAGQKLAKEDTGKNTQKDQKKAISILDSLIHASTTVPGGFDEDSWPIRPRDEGHQEDSALEPQPLVDPGAPREPATPGAQVRRRMLEKARGSREPRWRDEKPEGWKAPNIRAEISRQQGM